MNRKDFEIKNGILKTYAGDGGEVTVPDGVRCIGSRAFEYCRALTSVTIPASVTEIGCHAFEDCNGLKRVVLSPGLTRIGDNAFYNCEELTEIRVPDGVTHIGQRAFFCCSRLSRVTIPASVTEIGEAAFKGCRLLADSVGMVIIGGVLFDYRGEDTQVTVPDGVTGVSYRAFGGCSHLRGITLPASVTDVADLAFSSCSGIGSMTLPDGVRRIGRGAFSGCLSLESLTLPARLTEIGEYAFMGCSRLKALEIPAGVTDIGERALEYCNGLKRLSLPIGIETIGAEIFPSEMRLDALTLAPDATDEKQIEALLDRLDTAMLARPFLLETLRTNEILKRKLQIRVTKKDFCAKFLSELIAGGEAQALRKLLTLAPKQKPEVIDRYLGMAENNAEIRSMLLEYKNRLYPPKILERMERIRMEKELGLREKTLADHKTIFSVKKQDGAYVITGYKGESDAVIIPAAIRGIPVRIALKGCQTIRDVRMEEDRTQIEHSAFSDCRLLRSVTVPASVTFIGESAFGGCRSLQTIRFTGVKEAWRAIGKDKDWSAGVPAKKVVCADGDAEL
ncbi:MAG: leucine-rich repeat protein [Clostridia bacterium]|nr:leucine-rich repeat protein [Clostridia bacterium]